jgi:hypothetical protein
MSDLGGRVLAMVGRSAPNEDATVLSDPTAKAVRLINSRRDSEVLLLKTTPFPAGGLQVGALAIMRTNISDYTNERNHIKRTFRQMTSGQYANIGPRVPLGS